MALLHFSAISGRYVSVAADTDAIVESRFRCGKYRIGATGKQI
ncbi:hypothetical protein CCACVL1_06975 [Corchorus capsularis]|uniref:Uncharacterized protein n=1 Tax=Corchorus capsularis TaxID=210143 RepID=A0A1R3JAL3_COCAP|nr:hypothetical protein CCACVL1_06975 [Corchorus capsularis]